VHYDPSGLDFNELIFATARIPAAPLSVDARLVRVRAFAPRAFRDLRNRCFQVKEWEYAESILNAASLNIFKRNGGGLTCNDGCDDQLTMGGDKMIYHIIRNIMAEEQQEERDAKARTLCAFEISFDGWIFPCRTTLLEQQRWTAVRFPPFEGLVRACT
jgi:hypothetical protein